MPTGSLAPDSPSSSTPLRPADLAPSEHGEHHRRVGRRQRGAEEQRGAPAEENRKCAAAATAAAVTSVPATPIQSRPLRGPEPPPADPHAAVEQDHRQRDRDDPLHRLIGQPPSQRPDVGRQRGSDQEERRCRNPQPLAGPAGQHRRDNGERRHQHRQAERPTPPISGQQRALTSPTSRRNRPSSPAKSTRILPATLRAGRRVPAALPAPRLPARPDQGSRSARTWPRVHAHSLPGPRLLGPVDLTPEVRALQTFSYQHRPPVYLLQVPGHSLEQRSPAHEMGRRVRADHRHGRPGGRWRARRARVCHERQLGLGMGCDRRVSMTGEIEAVQVQLSRQRRR